MTTRQAVPPSSPLVLLSHHPARPPSCSSALADVGNPAPTGLGARRVPTPPTRPKLPVASEPWPCGGPWAGGRARVCTQAGTVHHGVLFHSPAHLLQRLVSVALCRPLLMPPLGSVISTESPNVCVNTLFSSLPAFLCKKPTNDVCASAGGTVVHNCSFHQN